MDRYTSEALKTILCRELDEYARSGIKNHQDLDIVKDLLESLKNLEKIEMNSMDMDSGMDEYNMRGGNSYRMGNYTRGNSYNNYTRNSYARGSDMGGNNSYRYYDPYMMERGYSGTGTKEEIMKELHQMVQDTSDEEVKRSILDCISKMEK